MPVPVPCVPPMRSTSVSSDSSPSCAAATIDTVSTVRRSTFDARRSSTTVPSTSSTDVPRALTCATPTSVVFVDAGTRRCRSSESATSCTFANDGPRAGTPKRPVTSSVPAVSTRSRVFTAMSDTTPFRVSVPTALPRRSSAGAKRPMARSESGLNDSRVSISGSAPARFTRAVPLTRDVCPATLCASARRVSSQPSVRPLIVTTPPIFPPSGRNASLASVTGAGSTSSRRSRVTSAPPLKPAPPRIRTPSNPACRSSKRKLPSTVASCSSPRATSVPFSTPLRGSFRSGDARSRMRVSRFATAMSMSLKCVSSRLKPKSAVPASVAVSNARARSFRRMSLVVPLTM